MSDSSVLRKQSQIISRSSRPCDNCRRRKTRCIVESEQQKCGICLHRKTECTFNEEPPKRILPGVTEPPTKRRILPWVPETLHSQPQASPSPQDVLNAPERFPAQKGSSADGFTEIVTSHSHEHHSVENDGYDRSLGLNRSKFAELYGLGSDMEPILMRHRPYDSVGNEYTLPTHSIRRVLEHDHGVDFPVTFHMVTDEKSVNQTFGNSEADTVESCVRPHGEKLLRLFWKFVHPSYPIVYKEGFMEKYSKSYQNIDAALLGAIYLNAINWWYYDSHLSNQPIIDVGSLRKFTLKNIQNSYHRPRLSSIEAILLLLQCKPEDPLNPDHTFAWGLTSQALGVGEACGLHLDASEWAIPTWERSLRKRLSWALYMQDVWTALAHGRPTHISEDDWAVTDLSHNDFINGNGAPTPREEFFFMTSLTKILHSVLRSFYSVRASRLQDTVELFAIAQPILVSLESWSATLPVTLNMENLPLRQLSANGNIHLAYVGVKINVLRRLVRSTALAPLCLDIAVLNSIRQQAHETAQQAISLVRSLRLEHLDAFWYFAAPYLFSVIGSFCTLLLVTSLTPAERDHWREMLTSYLWTLRTMSKSNEPMRYAVNRLEGAILRGLEHALVVAVDGTSPVAFEATPGQFEADINGFAFGLSDTDGLDLNAIDLDAFDFLSNMGPS